MPPHFALNFERGTDLSAAPRKEVAEHCSEVASAEAYPWLAAVDSDVATLGPRELPEIVFESIPRKVSIDASAASSIIAESRAFFGFLEREYGWKQADACLRVLAGDGVKKARSRALR
jgi:hypothetical protein